MDKNKLEKQAIGIVAQLFDLAEVPVEKRQQINDTAYDYMLEQLRLHSVVWKSEQLCEGLHSTDFNGKCFKCGEQVFIREPK
tara:strand:+ start:286 stop:531 length:246 start_codon:yes stop_codon:yes gene_type:complete